MTPFTTTHIITVTDHTGTQRIPVMECEGALFTREEWDAAVSADWSLDDDRGVLFQGSSVYPWTEVKFERIERPTLYADYVVATQEDLAD